MAEGKISLKNRHFLLNLARETLETYLKDGNKPPVDKNKLAPELLEKRGCFVTLHTGKNHKLRGCIGYIMPRERLYKSIIDNAVNSAVNDPRFSPVSYSDLSDIEIEISVLSIPQRLKYSSSSDLLSKLVPLRDGIILNYAFCQSTFLPQVWEQIPDKEMFLSQLALKGGAPSDAWKRQDCEISTYHAEVFSESRV